MGRSNYILLRSRKFSGFLIIIQYPLPLGDSSSCHSKGDAVHFGLSTLTFSVSFRACDFKAKMHS